MGWGKIVLILLSIIVIAVIVTMAVFNESYNITQKYLDAGCEPLTANQYGTPSTWRCPEGTEIK